MIIAKGIFGGTMQRTWKVRLLFALALLTTAIYLLYPSSIYFSLSPNDLREVRQDKNAFAKHIPSWASDSHIVPGLDLQGGIHMVLGVDLARMLSDKAARIKDRLETYTKEQKATFTDMEYMPGDGKTDRIKVTFASVDNLSSFKKKALDRFDELIVAADSGKTLLLKLNPQFTKTLKRDAVDQTIHTIQSRIDKMGVTEPSITRRGEDQVQIQLPGYDNPTQAKRLIGRTAQLRFQMCDDETEFLSKLKDLPTGVTLHKNAYSRPDNSTGKDIYLQFPGDDKAKVAAYLTSKTPKGLVIKYSKIITPLGAPTILRTYTLFRKIELSGDDLIDASVSMGSQTDLRPSVFISFSPTGARVFDKLTKKSIGKRMAIVLEDLIDSAPVINQRISGGNASIAMGGPRSRQEMEREAKDLSLVLKAGALPAPVTFHEERSVGPSLGADSVKAGKQAFMVGGFLIALFMLIYYRKAGLISIIGLIFNISMVLAGLSWLGATITFPGVAGLLLTVGMAVDANIIINERIREELRLGKMPRSAVKAGYEAAFSAVLDANITTFIAGVILWQFGSGSVQNFATMLLIGTVSSVISAVFITRIFFDMATAKGPKTLSI